MKNLIIWTEYNYEILLGIGRCHWSLSFFNFEPNYGDQKWEEIKQICAYMQASPLETYSPFIYFNFASTVYSIVNRSVNKSWLSTVNNNNNNNNTQLVTRHMSMKTY